MAYIGLMFLLFFHIGILLVGFRKKNNSRWPVRQYIKKSEKKIKAIWEKLNEKERQSKIENEIYEGISFLRNTLSIARGSQIGTDIILEELSEKEGVLQKSYMRMLALLRVNKREAAASIISGELQTPMAGEYANLILKWDDINPAQLSETLISLQKSFKEMRFTEQKRKDEVVSDLLYFPVVINSVLIFINFVYVGYFMDQKEMLQMLF